MNLRTFQIYAAKFDFQELNQVDRQREKNTKIIANMLLLTLHILCRLKRVLQCFYFLGILLTPPPPNTTHCEFLIFKSSQTVLISSILTKYYKLRCLRTTAVKRTSSLIIIIRMARVTAAEYSSRYTCWTRGVISQ